MSSASGFFRGCRALMEAAKAKSSSASRTATKSKSSEPRKRVGRTSGILKQTRVSPALHQFLGVPEASRTDAVKKVWEYIKLNNLQNPANKKEIYCDDKLKGIFEGKDKVDFLEIGRLLSRHFVKTS
ncbi:hypothetical protein NMG60_11029336 [Bertholletia excelsa]